MLSDALTSAALASATAGEESSAFPLRQLFPYTGWFSAAIMGL